MSDYTISLVIRDSITGNEIRISGSIERLYNFLLALMGRGKKDV